ncbi:MAG: NUDIX domain-containing protein [bacterium]|nr:NUDIX domain-containing protein [bacterium]
MAASDRVTGVSCLLMSQAGLVLEVQKPGKWIRQKSGLVRIGLGSIGGTIEAGETPVGALSREGLEEIGCSIHIASASCTLEIDLQGMARESDWAGEPLPVMVWQSSDPRRDTGAKVVVFFGHILAVPRPIDLPAVITMSFEAMLQLGSAGLRMDDLVDAGALLKEREPIPRKAEVMPVGTIAVLCSLQKCYPHLMARIAAEAAELQSIGAE